MYYMISAWEVTSYMEWRMESISIVLCDNSSEQFGKISPGIAFFSQGSADNPCHVCNFAHIVRTFSVIWEDLPVIWDVIPLMWGYSNGLEGEIKLLDTNIAHTGIQYPNGPLSYINLLRLGHG